MTASPYDIGHDNGRVRASPPPNTAALEQGPLLNEKAGLGLTGVSPLMSVLPAAVLVQRGRHPRQRTSMGDFLSDSSGLGYAGVRERRRAGAVSRTAV
ncbi:hypothetical protein ABZT17_03065 [Streptomyces sp. NPDC005648]|uniref:hypothetical protein n=1 Tax=Streptomyces sp. NPDC005648 TaxID=3157044 RepID=UPI0033AD1C23